MARRGSPRAASQCLGPGGAGARAEDSTSAPGHSHRGLCRRLPAGATPGPATESTKCTCTPSPHSGSRGCHHPPPEAGSALTEAPGEHYLGYLRTSCTPHLGRHRSDHHGAERAVSPGAAHSPKSSQLRDTRRQEHGGAALPPEPCLSGPAPSSPGHPCVPGCGREKAPRAAHSFKAAGTRTCRTDSPKRGSGNANSPPSLPSSP